ncbi:macro domain-containing protein [Streptomyces melanogenes]|uniref:macro domain-containing protein n=1 Tax=Streptomyces melanogenes TaxID=67326 RepID=UPI00379FE6E0
MTSSIRVIACSGDILQADVSALVNPVNVVGVMGKGLALQFKKAYPAMFAAYKQACQSGDLAVGRMHVWDAGAAAQPRYVINFPTKGHWRSRSRIEDIDAGLIDLVATVQRLGIASLAIPALGAGLGGLEWADVEPRIRRAFADAPGVSLFLYPPHPPQQQPVLNGS